MNEPTVLRVRPAMAGDDQALADLDKSAWTSLSGFPSVQDRASGDHAAFFSLDNPPDNHLVAQIGDAVVGYVRLGPATPLPENAHVIQISGLAVSPTARRRGVAAALLAAAEGHATGRGARKLSLRVLSTNEPAIRLYDRLGFEREGLLRGEFLIDGRSVDDVLMAKPLG